MQNSTLSIQTYLYIPKNRQMWEDSAVDGIYEHQNGFVASTTWVGRRRAYWKIHFMYNKLSSSYKFQNNTIWYLYETKVIVN